MNGDPLIGVPVTDDDAPQPFGPSLTTMSTEHCTHDKLVWDLASNKFTPMKAVQLSDPLARRVGAFLVHVIHRGPDGKYTQTYLRTTAVRTGPAGYDTVSHCLAVDTGTMHGGYVAGLSFSAQLAVPITKLKEGQFVPHRGWSAALQRRDEIKQQIDEPEESHPQQMTSNQMDAEIVAPAQGCGLSNDEQSHAPSSGRALRWRRRCDFIRIATTAAQDTAEPVAIANDIQLLVSGPAGAFPVRVYGCPMLPPDSILEDDYAPLLKSGRFSSVAALKQAMCAEVDFDHICVSEGNLFHFTGHHLAFTSASTEYGSSGGAVIRTADNKLVGYVIGGWSFENRNIVLLVSHPLIQKWHQLDQCI
eukprot:TRINITY_DN32129_c0_g1_i1.p1 TRINITY_DN32129_c0_g1~~TRINITY_DN32129_c0_g1_i1.p1  ORF type:complete len:361 (-),score=53.59 TRINITY_DN32129_c0_g1_i1:197-1279(-)